MNSTVSAMQTAVNQNPFDTVARLVYADALEEFGNYKKSIYQRRFAKRLEKPLTDKQIEQLEKDLDHANGRRRKRTLSLENCINCARNALLNADRWSYVAGGTVANAYGYRSYQTVCVAVVRSNDTVRIGVAVTSGNKGSSPTTPVCGVAKNAGKKVFRAWADNKPDSQNQTVMLMVQTKDVQKKIEGAGSQDLFELQDTNLWQKSEDELR